MAPAARYFWLLACAMGPFACAGERAEGQAFAAPDRAQNVSRALATGSKPEFAEDGAPRLFPPLNSPATLAAGRERDGTERFVAYGLRVLSRPDGALELSREYLPLARGVQVLELPARLGGGFLFHVVASSATLFFRAQTFTGDLEPFARLDFEASRVVAGFDRLYVMAERPDRLVALDVERRQAIGLGNLPPSPSYQKLAFVDAWFGAVQVPLRGALVTFDAGTSWRPVGFAATSLEVKDDLLRVVGPDGTLDLDRSGVFTQREAASVTGSAENAVAQALRGQRSGRERTPGAPENSGRGALKLAVLRGFRDTDGSFIVANGGVLQRVRPRDGKVLGSDEHAYPGGAECNAVPLGQGYGFVCGDGAETLLYSFTRPLAMRRVRSFAGARYVASSGNGALVIRGGCTGTSSVPGAYCIAQNASSLREIRVRGDSGVERVVALHDGRVAVLVPPHLGAPGFLSLLDERGRERRINLKLPIPANHLLEQGLWLDGFVEQSNGLSGWVVGAEPFAGVRVALDGTVTAARPESSIDRVMLSGRHALLVSRTGRARESVDGGFEWSDVELPAEFEATRELRDDARLQGCSELGCSFGDFVRVGWRSGNRAARLTFAVLPQPTELIQPGGSRWLLQCTATGELSEAALPIAPRAVSRSDEATPAWAPFLEVPAPALRAREVGFDVAGNDTEVVPVHAYAWGERGSDWSRSGHVQLGALDRFRVSNGVYQSAPTRSPWPDATAAAEAFGFDGSGNASSFRAVLDAGQRAAALLVSSHGLLDLLLFEERKTVTHIPNAGRLGLNFGMLGSVAKLADAWYVASFNENHAFSVSRIAGGQVERVAEYPALDTASALLVRGLRGEQLGIWVIANGWYLFPIDNASHTLQKPLYQSAADLAKMPAPCGPEPDGFLLAGSPSLEPSLRFPALTEEPIERHVTGQFVWSALGVCTRALAADTESATKHAAPLGVAARPATTVPLTLSERRPQGRRWGFACSQ